MTARRFRIAWWETIRELRVRFSAVSTETQTIRGIWQESGKVYRDRLVRLWVDVADEPANMEFFAQFKETLKDRFQQLEVWITTYPVEVI